MPVDINELQRLNESIEDIASFIEGKHIILFIGGTGAGKSTTVHFLSGSQMSKV